MSDVSLILNGSLVTAANCARWTLADVLRYKLRATGTNVGCEQGICGSCTVLVDGLPARSCLLLAAHVSGSRVDTVEGLGTDESPHELQEEFSRQRALQCGFCTPGFLMLAAGLLTERPDATPAEIEEAISANLCRCTGYGGIRGAVEAVAQRRRAGGDTEEKSS
jgi:aerobic-type carbon monoxide dehydrogenase small subunit (CoxS/CutS family)